MKQILDDGINVFFGLGGVGKSYVCTHKMVQLLLDKKNTKKIISNYPIIFFKPFTFKQKVINYILEKLKTDNKTFKFHKKIITLTKQNPEIISSLMWQDNFTSEAIKNSIIIIDESHDRYTGVYAHELTKDDRKFFTKLRHNGNVVCLMSQSYDDIHPFLMRKITRLHEIKKNKWFFKKIPSSFSVETYLSVKEYQKKDEYRIHKKAKRTRYNKEKIPFTLLVAHSYNTHFFKDIRIEPEYISWYENLYNRSSNDNTSSDFSKNEEIKKPSLSSKDINNVISGLVSLGWNKKESVKIVNNYIRSNPNIIDISEILKEILKQEGN